MNSIERNRLDKLDELVLNASPDELEKFKKLIIKHKWMVSLFIIFIWIPIL